MKLCIVTPAVIKGDGQGRANHEVVWESIRRGHHITLITRSIEPELQHHPQITWVTFPSSKLPFELLRGMHFASKVSTWLHQHRAEVDVINVNGAVTLAPSDCNSVHFIHSAWLRSPFHSWRVQGGFYGAYQWLYSALNAHWEKRAFDNTKVVIAVSNKVRQELIDIGISPEHIQVIFNGVDLQEFMPGVGDRTALGLPENVPLALFVGDIRTNRKNLDTVLRALVDVPELHLAVGGDQTRSPYPAMASELGIDDRVHFLGFRRDIAMLMKAVDFFVFPSRYEACTLVLMEAMASGLPVVTAKSAGGSEVVTPDCGWVLANSEDVQGLAQVLRLLANDPELRQRMGQAAYTVALQHSWKSKAQSYVDLFEKMAQSRVPNQALNIAPY